MPIVDVRWRPSGGRGEYEHVPSDVLLGRNVRLAPLVSDQAFLNTDVSGHMKDGKPRLRRRNPNDRSMLNLPQLVAALALLPDSIREDHGNAVYPLRHKGYVISSITFDVEQVGADTAICIPLRMRILHDSGQIDLVSRLERVGELLRSEQVPADILNAVADFLELIEQGSCSSKLRALADQLLRWVENDFEASAFLDAPSNIVLDQPDAIATSNAAPAFEEMTADETKRKLRMHYRIDRSRRIRRAKVDQFKGKYGAVYCENCAFDFGKRYGSRGEGFIEVHHAVPLAVLLPNTVTFLSDLFLLCANCHRIVHRHRPDLTPNELKSITNL